MKAYCRGTAKIKHRDTDVVFDIQNNELHWQSVDSNERQMGLETHYQAEVDHTELGVISWSVWEYPVGFENHKETDVNGHTLIKDFEYGLEHESDDA